MYEQSKRRVPQRRRFEQLGRSAVAERGTRAVVAALSACQWQAAAPSSSDRPDRKCSRHNEVDYVSGRTRLFGIDVARWSRRSFAPWHRRHPRPVARAAQDFAASMPQLKRLRTWTRVHDSLQGAGMRAGGDAGGRPRRGCRGDPRAGQGRERSLARGHLRWSGLRSRRSGEGRFHRASGVMRLGAGGGDPAIAVAIAGESLPASLHIYDVGRARRDARAQGCARESGVEATAGAPTASASTFSSTSAGRRGDARMPFDVASLARDLVGIRRDRQARADAPRWPRPPAARPFTAAK